MGEHRLERYRAEIDAALEAGASKNSIARELGVTRATLDYYLSTRDIQSGRSESEVQDALRRLAESVAA